LSRASQREVIGRVGGVFVEDSERLGGASFAKQGKSKVIGCVRRSRVELEGCAELGDRFGRPSLLLEKNAVIAASMRIARMSGDCAQEVLFRRRALLAHGAESGGEQQSDHKPRGHCKEFT